MSEFQRNIVQQALFLFCLFLCYNNSLEYGSCMLKLRPLFHPGQSQLKASCVLSEIGLGEHRIHCDVGASRHRDVGKSQANSFHSFDLWCYLQGGGVEWWAVISWTDKQSFFRALLHQGTLLDCFFFSFLCRRRVYGHRAGSQPMKNFKYSFNISLYF